MQGDDANKDLEPIGLQEPHEGIKRAHKLSMAETNRIQNIRAQSQTMQATLQGSPQPSLEKS